MSFPSYSSASWSMRGAIIRQGPHQGAQKSTRTGMSLLRTSCSNVASVTSLAAPARQTGRTCHKRSRMPGGLRGDPLPHLSRQAPLGGKRVLSTRANTTSLRAHRKKALERAGDDRPTRADPFLRLHHQAATASGGPWHSSGANLSPVEALGSERVSFCTEAGGGSDGRHVLCLRVNYFSWNCR